MDMLFHLLEYCHRLTSIPLSATNTDNSVRLYSSRRGSDEQIDEPLYRSIVKKAQAIPKPFIVLDSDAMAFGVMRDASGLLVIAGPVLLFPVEGAILEKYAKRHNLAVGRLKLAPKSLAELNALMALLYMARTGEILAESEICAGNAEPGLYTGNEARIDEYIMQNSDEEITHISYIDEQNYLNAIREGKVDNWPGGRNRAESISADIRRVGKMASTPLKQCEYMLCTAIALAARAAIEGGLEPVKSYSYSDLCLQRLEKCKTANEMLALYFKMWNEFARMVKEKKNQRSKIPYVEKAKNYIASHLNRPYELADIAGELKVSKSYLSKKFNAEVGMSVMRYARKKRIETAANMLKFSSESISTIASYLCFQSQSHFGAAFKEFMGATPQKYREREQPIE